MHALLGFPDVERSRVLNDCARQPLHIRDAVCNLATLVLEPAIAPPLGDDVTDLKLAVRFWAGASQDVVWSDRRDGLDVGFDQVGMECHTGVGGGVGNVEGV